MEAGLLPSEEFRALCGKVSVAACRRSDPVAAALRKEFDITRLNAWVVVLDVKGETLASYVVDNVVHGCTKETAGEFPAQFSRSIEESLKRPESLQAEERRWRGNPRDRAAYNALVVRLDEMWAYNRHAGVADEVAADISLPEAWRDAARIDAFCARTRAAPEDFRSLLEEGEHLLVAFPGHALAPSVVRVLVGVLMRAPDPRSSAAACLARLDAEAGKAADPEPVRNQVKVLKAELQAALDRRQKASEAGKP